MIMSRLNISFSYPIWMDGNYHAMSDSFYVDEENYLDVISEPNPIDCLCETMQLVLIDKLKEKKTLPGEVIRFNKKANKLKNYFNKQIIEMFAEDSKKDCSADLVIAKIENDSRDISEDFIKLFKATWDY